MNWIPTPPTTRTTWRWPLILNGILGVVGRFCSTLTGPWLTLWRWRQPTDRKWFRGPQDLNMKGKIIARKGRSPAGYDCLTLFFVFFSSSSWYGSARFDFAFSGFQSWVNLLIWYGGRKNATEDGLWAINNRDDIDKFYFTKLLACWMGSFGCGGCVYRLGY